MNAIQIQSQGTPDVLRFEDVPTPEAGPGQVLIKVEAVAVNYSDVARRNGDVYPFPTPLPFIPGSEVAGTVAALGEGVSGPEAGTPVFALAGQDGSTGYAQYAIANAPGVIPIPSELGMDEACALVVAGSTAVLVLREVARLAPGESVLVQGAAGGVGSYAVQIAKRLGAGTVIAAASTTAKGAAAVELGADHAVDYTQPDWAERVRALTDGRGVDVVLEMTGGRVAAQSLTCLAPFGRVVVYGMASRKPLELDPATIRTLFYDPALNQSLLSFNLGLFFGLRPEAAVSALQTIVAFVASGQVKVQIGHVLPLSEAAEAHRMLEDRRSTGKIILKPWADAPLSSARDSHSLETEVPS